MKTDQHTHTIFSEDGRCGVDELCAAAIEQGIRALAITEHYDFTWADGEDIYYTQRAKERRAAMARAARDCSGRLEVLYGIEIGQMHARPQLARQLVESEPFDVVLGSVHNLRGDENIYVINYNSMADCRRTLERYFAELLEILDEPLFDVLAHLDYPLRVMQEYFDQPTLLDYRPLIEPVLRRAAQCGVALEINTCGVRRWQKTPGPERWALEFFRSCGGEMITFGSDAHYAGDCGSGISEGMALALAAGFTRSVVYRGRKPEFVPID